MFSYFISLKAFRIQYVTIWTTNLTNQEWFGADHVPHHSNSLKWLKLNFSQENQLRMCADQGCSVRLQTNSFSKVKWSHWIIIVGDWINSFYQWSASLTTESTVVSSAVIHCFLFKILLEVIRDTNVTESECDHSVVDRAGRRLSTGAPFLKTH